MTPSKTKIALLLLAVLLVVPQAEVLARSSKAGAARVPQLKPLVPREDLSIVPDPTEIFDQAVAQYQAGNLDHAQVLFNQVLKIDPRNADAHFNLGAIKEWKKDLQGALKHYKLAIQLKPGDTEIAEAVSSLEAKIQNQAIEEIETAKARRHEELGLHGQKAKEAFAAKNYEEAIYHLNQLVQAFPDDPKVQFALGQSLRAIKSFDWAAYRLKMAIFLDPQNDLYRKTLTELDGEVQTLKDKAYNGFAEVAVGRVKPLTFSEAANVGLGL
jgi:Flp pilus assembly protein TadD